MYDPRIIRTIIRLTSEAWDYVKRWKSNMALWPFQNRNCSRLQTLIWMLSKSPFVIVSCFRFMPDSDFRICNSLHPNSSRITAGYSYRWKPERKCASHLLVGAARRRWSEKNTISAFRSIRSSSLPGDDEDLQNSEDHRPNETHTLSGHYVASDAETKIRLGVEPHSPKNLCEHTFSEGSSTNRRNETYRSFQYSNNDAVWANNGLDVNQLTISCLMFSSSATHQSICLIELTGRLHCFFLYSDITPRHQPILKQVTKPELFKSNRRGKSH